MLMRFLKDTYDEYRGIDIEERNRQEREERKKAEEEYKANNFVPKWAKKYSIILTAFYLFIAFFQIYASIRTSHTASIIEAVIMSMFAIAGTIMLNIKGKTNQKIGSAIYLIFLIVQILKVAIK